MKQQNKVCPQCGSKMVVPIFYEEGDKGPHFTCRDCRWIGEGIIFSTEPYQWLLKLRVTHEAFAGPIVEVNLDLIKEKIIWQKRMSLYGEIEKVERNFTIEDIKRMEKGLKQCNVLSWERIYQNENLTLEGTSWRVEMEFGLERERVCKSGYNFYPPQWKAFCITVENLIGKPIQL